MRAIDLTDHIARAQELLKTVRHVPIATVNEDGSPHNSPVFMAFDKSLHFYWASAPDSVHSQNIERTKQVFVVLFDSTGEGGGLFIRATAQEVSDTDFEHAHAMFNEAREYFLREHVPADHFVGDSPQRLWHGTPQQFWVNASEKDEAGYVVRDSRYEISVTDLLREA